MERLYLASYKQTPEHNTRLDIKLKIDCYIQLMIIDIQSTTTLEVMVNKGYTIRGSVGNVQII